MSSAHLVDPELLPMLELFPKTEFSLATLPSIRAALASGALSAPIPENVPVTVTEKTVDGPQGAPPVRIVIYTPTQAERPLPALFHVHGGGYVLGTPEMSAGPHRILAAELGCVIVSVDYRLAPETPHPGPIEDCYAALTWLFSYAAELGVDATRIGIAGESAGGGLAASLALLARDRGELSLLFQHLIYPMLDDRTCTATDPHRYVGEYIWTRQSNLFGWSSYLGTQPGAANVSAYAAAARAADLTGLPATFIAVGALDLFLEENLEYGRRLMRAGVPVELHVYPGAFHGFQLAGNAAVSIAVERDSLAALRRGFSAGALR